MQVLYSKSLLIDASDTVLIKQLKKSILDAWKNYLIQLSTIARVAEYTHVYHENQLNRHIKVMNEELVSLKITRNPYVPAVLNSDSFEELLSDHSLQHIINDEIINKLFKQLLNKEFFDKYSNDSEEIDDYKIIHSLFKKIMLKNDVYISEIEEQFLGWTDDAQLIIKTVNKTLKTFFEKGEPSIYYVLPEIDWKEINNYVEDMYMKVINHKEELENLIDPIIKNWDSSRLNLTDYILIKMAICEFMFFPSIPVKVTINEYIEISKNYSTPKSKDFINGVLDKLLKKLNKENKVNKTGRGLIN